MVWTSALSLERLRRDRQVVAKLAGKQIALFAANDAIYACNNRCPHEGYPLREGTLADDCVLTCNWHGWKFDLRTGDNLLQGDRLRTYPTKVVDGTVWVDLSDPPPAERQAHALASLRKAFSDHEYDRMARELARLQKAGADPLDAVAAAIDWSHDHLRFGTTHAYAAAAGWLALYDRSNDAEARLVCLNEAIGHMAWDCLREPPYPFPVDAQRFEVAAFLTAVEAQNERLAIALLRGALADGFHFSDLERTLTAAALRHYADFGHSLIYVVHTGRLINRLGTGVEGPLLLALVRSLLNASREDLIPEFRRYSGALADWPQTRTANGRGMPEPEAFLGRSSNETMSATVDAAAATSPQDLYRSLLGASAINLVRYDIRCQERVDNNVAENIGWLDFTHGLTFANTVRLQCSKFPELWPQGLLQMACFVGRNNAFVDRNITVEAWRPDRESFARDCIARITDHGEPDYIHSAHLVKTFLAADEEIEADLPGEAEAAVMAAVNRYFNDPWKRKHARRIAHQALDFVALED
jgi:nitrite reductase/ring-hydroxylating ferredoxin subunit